MTYVSSGERSIPLPSNYVDVMFTMNAMDHVSSFSAMAAEVVRVVAPGGLFIAAFNLGEPPTVSEPQRLTEDRVCNVLLRHFDVKSARRAVKGPKGDVYQHIRDGGGPAPQGEYLFCVSGTSQTSSGSGHNGLALSRAPKPVARCGNGSDRGRHF